MPGDPARHRPAGHPYPEAGEDPSERLSLGAFDVRDELGGRHGAQALETGEGGDVEGVEVGRVGDEAGRDQRVEDLVAEPLDVHGVATGEVGKRLLSAAD